MPRVRPTTGDVPAARGMARWATVGAQALAVGLVCVTPWLFAGVQAPVQPWLALAVACAVVLCVVRVVLHGGPRVWGWVAVAPLAAGLVLVSCQLLPLDRSVLEGLSPLSVALRDVLESNASSADTSLAGHFGMPTIPNRLPLSLYPAATRRELSLVSMAVGMFLVGSVCFASRRGQQWLGIAIAVNATLLVFLGFVQLLTWNGKMYWEVSLSEGGGPFGPFVNRNNAGGYLNLCLAGALGWMIYAFARDRRIAASPREPDRPARLAGWPRRWLRGVHAFFARLNGVKLAALLLTAWIAAGVLATISRGAWIAMVGAALVTAFFVLLRKQRAMWVWLAGFLGAGAIGVVAWSGTGKRVMDQFGTLLDEKILTHGLLGLWRDALRAVPDFWLTGTGLGTFRYVYGPYARQPADCSFHYAENQYVQALIETGLVGLALIVLMIVVVGLACWRIVTKDPSSRASAFAIGGLFALTAQAIHACFDFGLSIPANMLLFALLCGALVGRASALGGGPTTAPLARFGRGAWAKGARLLAAGAIVLLLGVNAWAVRELSQNAAVDSALRSARFKVADFNLSDEKASAAIDRLSGAVEGRPDDAEGHQRLARLWIHRYRLQALPVLMKADGRATDPEPYWPQTLPLALHRRVHEAAREGRTSDLEALRNDPAVRECLVPAMRHFVEARRHCPLLPYTHLGIAELCGLFVAPDQDQFSLDRARGLAPADPRVLFESGLADLNAGRRDAAYASFRKCLALGNRYLPEILKVADERMSLWEVVEQVLPDSPQLLLDFAGRTEYQAAHYTAVRHRLAQRALDALDTCDLSDDEKCHLRASALVVQGRFEEAAAEGHRAVRMQPRQLPWRYELALLLKSQGRLDEAHEQARVCAMLNPSRREYRQLLEQINLARLTSTTPAETRN